MTTWLDKLAAGVEMIPLVVAGINTVNPDVVIPQTDQNSSISQDVNQKTCNISEPSSQAIIDKNAAKQRQEDDLGMVTGGLSDIKDAQDNKNKGEEDREISLIAARNPSIASGKPNPNKENTSNQQLAESMKQPVTTAPNVSSDLRVNAETGQGRKIPDIQKYNIPLTSPEKGSIQTHSIPLNADEKNSSDVVNPKDSTDSQSDSTPQKPSSDAQNNASPQNAENVKIADSMKDTTPPSTQSEESEQSDSGSP